MLKRELKINLHTTRLQRFRECQQVGEKAYCLETAVKNAFLQDIPTHPETNLWDREAFVCDLLLQVNAWLWMPAKIKDESNGFDAHRWEGTRQIIA